MEENCIFNIKEGGIVKYGMLCFVWTQIVAQSNYYVPRTLRKHGL